MSTSDTSQHGARPDLATQIAGLPSPPAAPLLSLGRWHCLVLVLVLFFLLFPCWSRELLLAEQTSSSQRANWEAAGLRVLDSPHLTLVTDLPSSPAVDELPRVFELAIEQWSEYFGVNPAQFDSWHLVGSLMVDRQRFRQAGLLPESVPDFPFGYQDADRLWMLDQPSDYYRRHLLLHEGTHAVVRHLTGGQGPPWYNEGLAELLATHRWADGRLQLNIVPADRNAAPLWGRVKVLRDAVASDQVLALADVMAYGPTSHRELAPYAWSWAALQLLDHHPRYRGARALRDHMHLDGPAFRAELLRALGDQAEHLEADWQVMVEELDYGYSVAEGAAQHEPSGQLTGSAWSGTVAANKSWQSTGLRVGPDQVVRVMAEGRVSLGTTPRPWPSEPAGVTAEYHGGRPLGELTARLRWDEPDAQGRRWSPSRPVGEGATLSWPAAGTLYLRINERPGALGDNSGEFHARVQPD